MTENVLMAGQGGQGMILLGKLLAGMAMKAGLRTTYFPSYGTEVRGGTAHCHVKVADEEIFLPNVEHADTLVVMNQPSMERFGPRLKAGGLLLINSSMVEPPKKLPDGATVHAVPATQIAHDLGDMRVCNMVMLGAYQAASRWLTAENVEAYLAKTMTGRKAKLLPLNRQAVAAGAAAVKGG
jgi:2-oxoglutarate ferredoxin oxidoreductase subunit gamma